jgi:group I intron endonuclease
MRNIAGIYKIVNLKNGKFYVGSSKNIIRRFGIHKSALKHNRHHCIYLQRSWNKHGAAAFIFEILKEMSQPTESQLFEEELKHIQDLLPAYNVGGVGGGDNLTNNPNRDAIIKRMTLTLRDRISQMSETERKLKWSRPGNKNPNWQGGVSAYHCVECGNDISYGRTRCMECSKNGKQNPMYGKHHTDEYKLRASKRMKGKLPTNAHPIILDGISYVSQAAAARELNVSIGSISNWVRGKFKRRQAS